VTRPLSAGFSAEYSRSLALTFGRTVGTAADKVITTPGKLDLGVWHAVVSPAGAPIVTSLNIQEVVNFLVIALIEFSIIVVEWHG